MSTLKKYLLSSGKVREDELWVGWFGGVLHSFG
jgi:hypothetical protein